MKRSRSLARDIAWPLLVAMLIAGVAAYLWLDWSLEQQLTERFDQQLLNQSSSLSAVTRFEVADPEEDQEKPWVEFDFDPENFPRYEAGADAEYFELWLDGEALGRSRSLPAAGSLLPVGQRLMQPPGTLRFQDQTLPDGRRGRQLLRYFLPVFDEDWHSDGEQREQVFSEQYPGQTRPLVGLALAVDRAPLDAMIGQVRRVLALSIGGLLALSAALLPILVRRGLGALHALNRRLAAVDVDHLQTEFDRTEVPRELHPMLDALNALLRRIELAFDKERLFSRNVAHELRTPIAELRSLADVGGQWPDDANASREFFRLVGQSALRMDRLVANLLLLARHEQQTVHPDWQAVDLAAEIDATLLRHQAENDIRSRQPRPCPIRADPCLLQSILNNLVDNMLQHRSSASDCEILCSRDGAQLSLQTSNPAAALTAADLDQLFDRFWRKDEARSGDRHSGLGLCLVKTLCQSMGWQVSAHLDDRQCLRIQLSGLQSAPWPDETTGSGSSAPPRPPGSPS